jgi:hypothetical protein
MAVFAGRVEVLATARDVLPLRDLENFPRDTPKGLDRVFHSTASTTKLTASNTLSAIGSMKFFISSFTVTTGFTSRQREGGV